MLGNNKLRQGLRKTRRSFFGRVTDLFRENEITDEMWDELEMLLVQADVGIQTTMALIEGLRERVNGEGLRSTDEVEEALKEQLVVLLAANQRPYLEGERMLDVVLVVGVNGSGKTTSIAKLAKYHKDRGDRVVLAAADTFRAGAIDQLQIWAGRVGVPVVAHQASADPGAVVYDAIRASQSRDADVLIIDTAGRLHTQHNLMQELRKIRGIAGKQVHKAPHESLLVLDATTGQNALSQAKHFTEQVGVSGVVLAKLDSTAKGGMAFAVGQELQLPILFAATGESLGDWAPFDPQVFVDSLFAD